MLRSDFLLLLPVIVPFLTAILAVLGWNQRRFQRILSITGSLLLLLVALLLFRYVYRFGPQAVQIGNWQAPYGNLMSGSWQRQRL